MRLLEFPAGNEGVVEAVKYWLHCICKILCFGGQFIDKIVSWMWRYFIEMFVANIKRFQKMIINSIADYFGGCVLLSGYLIE